MDNKRYEFLHNKWKDEGLTDREKDEFGRIITERVDLFEEQMKIAELNGRDLHHLLPTEARTSYRTTCV